MFERTPVQFGQIHPARQLTEWLSLWHWHLRQGMALDQGPLASGERWLLNWAGVSLILGAGIVLICGYHAGFSRLNTLTRAHPDWLWSCLTLLGDERTAFALTLSFSLRRPRLFWALILAGLLAMAASRGLKELIDAARPPAVLVAGSFHLIGPALTQASFPSGHSTTAAVLAGTFIAHTRWIEVRLLLLILATLVGLSRVAVGVHWPLDVLGGLMIGALSAWLGGRLAARWPAPGGWLGVHLTAVGLAALAAFSLLIDDGGYPAAAWFGRLIAIVALIGLTWHYLKRPAPKGL